MRDEPMPPTKKKPETVCEDGVLTLDEAAAFLKCSRRSITDYIACGKLGYTTVGRTRKIPRKALVEYLDSGFVPARK